MSQLGFVYILVNQYMPDVFKVGCTERSPHARAEELSRHTGVPAPFKVLCYIEVDDFQSVERAMHRWLKESRISDSREFFYGEGWLYQAARLLYWNPNRIGFCRPCRAEPTPDDFDEIVGFFKWDIVEGADHNPWRRKEETPTAEDESAQEAEPT